MSKSYNIRTCIAIQPEFGSRKVIELLSSLGVSASYDEVRRFLTSAAMSIQPAPGSIYSPPGFEPVDINNSLTFFMLPLTTLMKMKKLSMENLPLMQWPWSFVNILPMVP